MTDWEEEEERHRRRMFLMHEMGKVERLETRLNILSAVTVSLIAITLILLVVLG